MWFHVQLCSVRIRMSAASSHSVGGGSSDFWMCSKASCACRASMNSIQLAVLDSCSLGFHPYWRLFVALLHARARAVGLVTGSHTRTPPHPQPVGSGPRQPAERAGSRAGRAPDPGRPTHRQEAPPPGCRRAAPTARKASSQERALWGW